MFFLSVSRRHFKFDVRCFDRCLCKPFQFLKTPDVKCKEFYFYCLEASSPPTPTPHPPRAANPTCLSDISKGTRCEIPLPSDSVKGVHKSTWTHQCPCTAPPPCLPRLPHDNTHTHLGPSHWGNWILVFLTWPWTGPWCWWNMYKAAIWDEIYCDIQWYYRNFRQKSEAGFLHSEEKSRRHGNFVVYEK